MNLMDLAIKVGVKDEATGKVNGIASNVVGKLGGAAKGAGIAVGAAVAAVAAGTVAIGKAAMDSYAKFEQLEGGVKKLFGAGGQSLEQYAQSMGQSVEEAAGKFHKLEEAQSIVMRNAQQAFKTAGMSVNDYMEQVTGFSAALVNSLGGDTVEAANRADVAMRAISDNVNTFGTDIQSVTWAFQGFAKQNYTMLDNLKLGYGGTKSEMERLIADANEYAASIGKASDLSIDSFADIVTAIDLVQQKQGIAGTTAREAATTIEGSVNMAKSAWSNWVTELGKDNADMEARTRELVESIGTAAQNIIPRIGIIFQSLLASLPGAINQISTVLVPQLVSLGGQLLATVGGIVETLFTETLPNLGGRFREWFANIDLQELGETIKTKSAEVITSTFDWLIASLPDLFDAALFVLQLITTIGTSLMENAPLLGQKLLEFIGAAFSELGARLPEIIGSLGDFIGSAIEGIGTFIADTIEGIPDAIDNFLTWMEEHGPELKEASDKFFRKIGEALEKVIPRILAALLNLVLKLPQVIGKHAEKMILAAKDFFWGLIIGLLLSAAQLYRDITNTINNAIATVRAAVGAMLNAAREWFQGLVDGARQKADELIAWVQNIPNMILGALGNLGSLLWNAGKSILDGLWNGMKSAWDSVSGWVSSLAGKIQSLKGPLPYDKVVLVENGMALMDGLSRGLHKQFEGEVLPYVSRMADKMGEAFGNPSLAASYAVAAPAVSTASDTRPSVVVNLAYNAGEDATKMAYDIADVLRLLG